MTSRKSSPESTSIGPKHRGFGFIRPSLAGLTLLFAHYAIVLGVFRYNAGNRGFSYLNFSSVYDVLLEIGLAFGMVLLAAERVRVELEERNRKLAEAGEELAKAARTDPLTGLLNRRAFEEYAANADLPAGSVAILDINDLKPINDEHGHPAGDVALQLVARQLRIHFRVTDPMFRLGGDEYAVVMPAGTAEELAFRLSKIDQALAGQRLPGLDRPIDLAVSWGVAPYDSGEGLKAAAARADERMYAQKKKRKGGSRTNLSSVFA
jgi:diguanylate cyclase (GGDEF)-like protein